MKKLFVSLLIGLGAGIIDVIPMVAMKLDWYSNCSAAVHWVVLGVVISYISFDMKGWLKGIVTASICSLPVLILVLKEDPKSIVAIIVMSVLLGCLVGIMTEKYAR